MSVRMQPKGYMSSGLLAANSLIKSTPGRLGNLMAMTSGTGTAFSLILYDTDTTSAAGNILAKLVVSANDVFIHKNIPLPDVVFRLGCYAVYSNCEYIVHFS